MKNNPEILMDYFQTMRKKSTGVILKIDDFYVLEIIMEPMHLGFGITMDKSSFSLYEIDTTLKSVIVPERFKLLFTENFVGQDYIMKGRLPSLYVNLPLLRRVIDDIKP